MAKLKAAEMTAEQLAAKHAKSKERRDAKRDKMESIKAELLGLLTEKQVSKECWQWLTSTYTAPNVYIPQEGDTLAMIMEKHQNISAKKLAKKCEEAGLKVDWGKGVLVKA